LLHRTGKSASFTRKKKRCGIGTHQQQQTSLNIAKMYEMFQAAYPELPNLDDILTPERTNLLVVYSINNNFRNMLLMKWLVTMDGIHGTNKGGMDMTVVLIRMIEMQDFQLLFYCQTDWTNKFKKFF
jgi:hypothetical protein